MNYWILELREGASSFAQASPVADLLVESDEELPDGEVREAICDLQLIAVPPPIYVVRPTDKRPVDPNRVVQWTGKQCRVWVIGRVKK